MTDITSKADNLVQMDPSIGHHQLQDNLRIRQETSPSPAPTPTSLLIRLNTVIIITYSALLSSQTNRLNFALCCSVYDSAVIFSFYSSYLSHVSLPDVLQMWLSQKPHETGTTSINLIVVLESKKNRPKIWAAFDMRLWWSLLWPSETRTANLLKSKMIDLQIIFSESNDKLLQNARAVDGVVHQSLLSTCIAHLSERPKIL